jgi:hypothetical protein
MYYFYSTEPLPNPDMMGMPGYTPDSEYIKHGGFVLASLPAQEWTPVKDLHRTIRHRDWTDRKGTVETIHMEDIVPALRNQWTKRGVVILDHEPTDKEKRVMELKSEEAQQAFMMTQVEWYENQVREKEVTGHGRTKPTPYEDMCYERLKLTKPYSVEAMRAQRHPGESVGEQIVEALERRDKRRELEQEAKNEKAAHPKPAPTA